MDSGATSHFLVTEAPKTNVQTTVNPLIVRLPDGAQVGSTTTCTLALPKLPVLAREGHIIPGLASNSLFFAVRLFNAGCDVKFTKIYCTVVY